MSKNSPMNTSHFTQLMEKLCELQNAVNQIQTKEGQMANSVANLQAIVTNILSLVQGEDSSIAAMIAALQAASPTGDNPAIDAVVTQLTGLATDVTNQTQAINTAVAPPPVVTPPPATS
jgi:hypothetical protein